MHPSGSSRRVFIFQGGRQSIINFIPPLQISMPKKVRENKRNKLPDIRTFPISKHKSFIVNLNSFIKMLQENHHNLTSRQFLNQVHSFVGRYQNLQKKKDPNVEKARHKIKICKKCNGWSGNSRMIQCALCEDYYHQQCIPKNATFKDSGLCVECDQQKIPNFDKETYLNELIEDSCHHCEKERENREAFVHCLRCSHRFHKRCYGKNVVVCTTCKVEIDQQLKNKNHTRQSTLVEWCSSAKKKSQTSSPITLKTVSHSQFYPKQFLKNKEDSRTQPFRQKDDFTSTVQEMTVQQINKYKDGLIFAILAKKMKYTEELQPVECSLDINNQQSLDFGLAHMSRSEYEVYRRYKKQPIGPFKFVFKEGMGYDVVADKDIKEKTLICQYIGEVVSLRRCIELEAVSKNDSLMQLRTGPNSDQTLIIRPDRLTNMARFINGVNNHKTGSRPNVATVRKLAKGMPTVVLYSIRAIRRGESLLYDYNAGATNCKYDTSQFI